MASTTRHWGELLMRVADMVRIAGVHAPVEETTQTIRRVIRPREYLAHDGRHRGPTSRFSKVVRELDELVATALKARALPDVDVSAPECIALSSSHWVRRFQRGANPRETGRPAASYLLDRILPIWECHGFRFYDPRGRAT
jgi:hypothetical protein